MLNLLGDCHGGKRLYEKKMFFRTKWSVLKKNRNFVRK